MAKEKEAFLSRWSRLKRRPPPEASSVQKVEEKPAPPLPPVESLTPDSDFSAFMGPKVKDELRRVALKKLFSDPHFNLADPFEAYSGDWTAGEAIPQEMLATLNQARSVLLTPEERQALEEREASEKKEVAGGEPKQDEPGRQDT
jgi:hypothetical protein